MELHGEFWSGLIGALIGGAATLLASWWQHHLENKRKQEENDESINATLQAIKAELECLRERYDESIGRQLESTNDDIPFLFYYYATEDYFTIYTQNSFLIGQIPNDNLRKKIVAAYIKMKGLLDTYKTNNGLLEKYDYYHMLFLETNLPAHEQQAALYYTLLLNYLPSIKESHKQATELGDQLIENISDYLNPRYKVTNRGCLCAH